MLLKALYVLIILLPAAYAVGKVIGHILGKRAAAHDAALQDLKDRVGRIRAARTDDVAVREEFERARKGIKK